MFGSFDIGAKNGFLVGLVWLLFFSVFSPNQTAAQEQVKLSQEPIVVGVLATEGATRAIEAWSKTIDVLNETAASQNQPFVYRMEPHTHASLLEAVEQGRLHLVLSDPAQFVQMSVKENARAILSTATIWDDRTIDQSGALIFARQNSEISTISDLEGARVMAVAPNGFAGWWLAEQEFLRHRLEPTEHFGSIVFSRGNAREVVYAVQSGLVDAGIIRTGLLEMLDRQGVIQMSDFVAISPRSATDFPFLTSTQLYPERVLAALPNVSEEVLAQTINTLLSLPPTEAGSDTAVKLVWQAPQNYQSVHDLLIQLRAPPYENFYFEAASRILKTYKWAAIAISIVVIGSIAALAYELRRNAQLAEERKNVLQSEVRSKKFYRNAVEEHTVFCMLTSDGAITHVNNRFASLLDRRRSNLINMPLSELIKDSDNKTVLRDIISAVEVGAPWQGAVQLAKSDDTHAWVQCTFIPVTNSSAELSEIALVATDVTKTRSGVSEERFENTLELIQDQVVVLKPGDLEILYCNDAADKRLIRDRMGGDWRGAKVEKFVTPEDFEILKMRCDAIEKGPQRRIMWEAENKDGVTFEISLEYCNPKHDEPRIVAMYRDISERKIAEKAKNEFITTISHELRTPITSIKGALSLAASGTAGELPEKAEKLVKLASTNCERLHLLINDILDLEKIESGKMDFKMAPCDLVPLLEEANEANQHYATQFGVTYTLDIKDAEDGLITYGDHGRLRQVLDNLMSNAAKFSPRGSNVHISLGRYKGRLRISVRDFGSGIPKAAQATIFDKFTQADSSDTRSKGGTGLGLAIVRQIIESHKGRLFFVSEENVGSEFFCELPIMEGEAVLQIPSAQEDGEDEEPKFSRAVPDDLPETFMEPNESEFEILLDVARTRASDLQTEIGRVSAVQVAKGRGVLSQSKVLTWLDAQQRAFLVDLLIEKLFDNRAVSIVEMKMPMTKSAADQSHSAMMLSMVTSWITEVLKDSSQGKVDKESVKLIVVGGGEEVAVPAGFDATSVLDAAQALTLAQQDEADFVAWLGQTNDSSTVTVLPLKGGCLPQSMPLTMIVGHSQSENSELGIVSKFSSIDGGGRGRARRRGGNATKRSAT